VDDQTSLGLAPSDAVLDTTHVDAFIRYLDALDLKHPVSHDERPAASQPHHSTTSIYSHYQQQQQQQPPRSSVKR